MLEGSADGPRDEREDEAADVHARVEERRGLASLALVPAETLGRAVGGGLVRPVADGDKQEAAERGVVQGVAVANAQVAGAAPADQGAAEEHERQREQKGPADAQTVGQATKEELGEGDPGREGARDSACLHVGKADIFRQKLRRFIQPTEVGRTLQDVGPEDQAQFARPAPEQSEGAGDLGETFFDHRPYRRENARSAKKHLSHGFTSSHVCCWYQRDSSRQLVRRDITDEIFPLR